jgi:hypothetical protein
MRLFSVIFLVVQFFVVGSCLAQNTRPEQRQDSLSRVIRSQQKRDSLFKMWSFYDVDVGRAYVYSIDGLIISQAKYDSLNITYEEIRKREVFSKAEGKNLYGGRGEQGVIAISVKQIVIFNSCVLKKEERSAKLKLIDEKDIKTLRILDAKELLSQFGIKHRWGAIFIETMAKR